MPNTLREKYKVEKSNIEEAYEYALGLKYNIEYEKRVDDTFISLANLFKEMYPHVKIEPPRGREKSKQSVKNKIEKLEMERLCKLYAIGEISDKEILNLYILILNKERKIKINELKNIFNGEIENLKEIDRIMQEEEIEEHTKTAILRIANTRFIQGNREDLQTELDEKYGEAAAEKTKQLKDNLLHWECIKNINDETRKKLHSPHEYLKVKDLRAFKFVVANVPDTIQTDNETLKELIEKRKQAPKEEQTKYNDLCCIELTKDFVDKLINDEEILEKLNVDILPDGHKHKQKQNGYIAEHIKFCFKDHPEYTFEMQLRSIYREDMSRANGKAAHDKRSGKKRRFPSTEDRKSFITELEETLPQYKMLKSENGKFKLEKCSKFESMLEYFLGYVNLDSKPFKKAIQYIEEEEQKQK